jgi:hypothetical protein
MKKIHESGDQNLIKAALAAALSLLVSLGVALPSYGQEYVPPPEAFEGPGGWAVVDPTTGIVYGVIVGDWDEQTWQEVKNTRTVDGYMGCPAPCELRFQTRATEDGNVAGWHGTETTVDENGNATQTNNGSVRYDDSSGTFQINNRSGDGTTTTQTLIPEKTSRDSSGQGRSMNLSSGIVDIRTKREVSSGGQSATVDTYQSDLNDKTIDAVIALPGLGADGTSLQYVFGSNGYQGGEAVSELGQIQTDLISILLGKGFKQTVTTVDEETGEQSEQEVLALSHPFVEAILNVGRGIVDFLGSLLGFGKSGS